MRRAVTGLAFCVALCAASAVRAQTVRVSPFAADAGSGLYGGVEYLRWWVKGAPLSVPLVSTGPNANYNGFLLNSNTTILYGAPFAPASGGNDTQDFGGFSGGRITAGYRVAPGWAIEVSGFGLGSQQAGYQTGATDGTRGVQNGLRIPLYNAVPYFVGVPVDAVAQENGLPVYIPGTIGGQVRITNRLSLWGLDAVGVRDLAAGAGWTLSAIGGLRYLDLTEDFDLADYFYGINSTFAGESGIARDHFGTRNRFVGPTLGLRGEADWGPFSLAASGRLGLGTIFQELSVSGAFQAVNWTPASGAQGIFAQPNNSGNRSSTAFAVAPEVQLKLGYDLTPNVRLTLGYDFLYLSSVVRPGDQIDRNIPKGQTFAQGGTAISTTYPARLFRTTDFYAQGLSAGVSFRF